MVPAGPPPLDELQADPLGGVVGQQPHRADAEVIEDLCAQAIIPRVGGQAESLSAGSGKVAYFEGTPIPTSVLLTAILAVAIWQASAGDWV